MTRKEDMAALQADTQVRYNCTQRLVIPFAQDMGITREQARDLTRNFGSGMGCGATCGALVGALMVMGGLDVPQEKRQELIQKFCEENGAMDCAPLLKAAAERGEEKKSICGRLVRQCMDFVCEETGLE